MTLQRLAFNAYLVKHCGVQKTFVDCTFADMIRWARMIQTLEI